MWGMASRGAKSVIKNWRLEIRKPIAQVKHLGPIKNPQNGPRISFKDEKLVVLGASKIKLGIF